jgi:DNA gyrase subunit A
MYPANMHATMMFFTEKGRCYWMKVYQIPEGTKTSKGRAIQNLLNIDADDRVNAFVRVKHLNDSEFVASHYLVFCTKHGVIKKTLLEAYSRPRQNGVNAIELRDGDKLIDVRLTNGKNEIIIANRTGLAIRFNEAKVRAVGRNSVGMRGQKLAAGDEVVGMIVVKDPTEHILVVSEKGYGKRSELEEYRVTNRGGKGVKTMNITEKTGPLVTIKTVTDDNDLMIINKSGITIRIKVANLSIIGRATQGVRLINLEKRDDEIASVCKVASEEDIEEAEVVDSDGIEGIAGQARNDGNDDDDGNDGDEGIDENEN